MSGPSAMISLDIGGGRFNFRTAGIVLRQGHVLIHKARIDTHWSLPGGRVEIGEETAHTLLREVDEELGVQAEIGRLRFVMENFFVYDGKHYHELGFYYALTLPDDFAFDPSGAICHECVDGPTHLEFKWVPADVQTLTAINFQPEKLRGRLLDSDAPLLHITHQEFAQ